jgi:hypothetical protein
VQQHLRVARGLEDRPLTNEFFSQFLRIDEVAVVADCDLAVGAVDQKRLRVFELALASGGIAHVADRGSAGEPGERPLVERVGDVAHRPGGAEPLTVACDDSRALLAAMLQGVQPQVREVGRLCVVVNAENAALFAEFVHFSVWRGAPPPRPATPRCRSAR